MADRAKAQIGDWVRFRRGGVLVVGVVAYVKEAKYYWQGGAVYETDIGEIDHASLLEVRRG